MRGPGRSRRRGDRCTPQRDRAFAAALWLRAVALRYRASGTRSAGLRAWLTSHFCSDLGVFSVGRLLCVAKAWGVTCDCLGSGKRAAGRGHRFPVGDPHAQVAETLRVP